jgi:hypothetical protein
MTALSEKLLEVLAGGHALDLRLMLTELLSTAEGVDPRVREMLLKTVCQEVNEDENARAESDEQRSSLDGPTQRQLKRRLFAIQSELRRLREQNDRLAAALGACRDCWGANIDCASCGGKGQSGSSPPNRRLFREWIVPAVRAVRVAAPSNSEVSKYGEVQNERL